MEKRTFIEWGNKQVVIAQFKSIESFMETDWMHRQAANFGQLHLVEREMARWSKYPVYNIFVVEADPVFNYGLDFKCYIHYTADGINFMKKLSTGGSSISSAPLVRVTLNIAKPKDFDFNNLDKNSDETIKEWIEMISNNVVESFEYSTNVAYRKDSSARPELREMCKDKHIIFA